MKENKSSKTSKSSKTNKTKKTSKTTLAYLIVSGLVATAVGSFGLLDPAGYQLSNGAELHGQIALLNDIRGAGGGLLAIGLFVIFGSFSGYARAATIVATTLCLGYGSARSISLLVDGMPSESLMFALGLELLLGIAGLALLYRERVHSAT